MTKSSLDRIVLSYLGDDHYHASLPDDDLRPVCQPERIRGVPAIRSEAERRGQTPCPSCWPDH